MDYIEAFKNLKTNNKYGRKSPHKAVLLLTIIEMYENDLLHSNEIVYNETLKDTFIKVWNRTMPNESTFFSEAFYPFWYMQSEGFWHIVPIRNKEDILTIMRDNNVKPSESKICECVRYAELDEDLYFLITISSGRSSLKRTLLETYTTLPLNIIDKLSESNNRSVDHSIEALNNYKHILEPIENTPANHACVNKEYADLFKQLSEDIQLTINIEYYSFLKNNRMERTLFRDICPTVYDFYYRIAFNPFKREEISQSFSFKYENLLSDLKISLLSDDDSIDLIDKINGALCLFRDEEELSDSNNLELSSDNDSTNKDVDVKTNNTINLDNNDLSQIRIANDGLFVENTSSKGIVKDFNNQTLFEVNGQLKILNGKIYRFNYKQICFTVKEIKKYDNVWEKSNKLIVSYDNSDLHPLISPTDFVTKIENISVCDNWENNRIKFDGKWFDYRGYYIDNDDIAKSTNNMTACINNAGFVPKTNFNNFNECVRNSYDYLWMIAIIDLISENYKRISLNYDNIACMMIANAWVIINNNEELKCNESTIVKCIEFLIEESNNNMDGRLTWNSDKGEIYEAIKDYPMFGVFEDTVEELISTAPYNVISLWIKTSDIYSVVALSQEYSNGCLYAIYPKNTDPYIKINNKWTRYLFLERNSIISYFTSLYVDYVSKK